MNRWTFVFIFVVFMLLMFSLGTNVVGQGNQQCTHIKQGGICGGGTATYPRDQCAKTWYTRTPCIACCDSGVPGDTTKRHQCKSECEVLPDA